MTKLKKILIAVVVIIILSAVAWKFLAKQDKGEQLITSVVRVGPLIRSVDAVGEVFAENLVDVGTRATGQIKELYVKVGDNVKVGDKIAQIDDELQQNALAQRKAELSSLQARKNSATVAYNIARTQYQREQNLAKNNATSAENLENFKNSLYSTSASLKEVEASITQAEISIKTAMQDLGYTNITAPFNGTIVSVPVEIGQTLNAVQSAPTVAQIADLSKMEVRMEVSEADISSIKVGNEVEYSILSDINKKYKAKVTSIDPGLTTLSDGQYSGKTSSSSSKSAVYYYVKMLIDNTDGFLRIGMTTQNTIIIDKIDNALQLSLTAIKNDHKGSYVFVKEGKEIKRKPVKLGVQTSNAVQILEGLKEGDVVISSHMNQEQIDKMFQNRQIRIR